MHICVCVCVCVYIYIYIYIYIHIPLIIIANIVYGFILDQALCQGTYIHDYIQFVHNPLALVIMIIPII